MIAIIDYNMGNLWSVLNAFRKIGAAAKLTAKPEEVRQADAIVLPGVGAFAQAMDNLNQLGMSEVIRERTADGVPFLGFCLGLQLLLSESEEDGKHSGLDIIKGKVVRFPPGEKVPQMGWNKVSQTKDDPILDGLPDSPHMYFAHSYYVVPEDTSDILGETEYGIKFASMLARGRIYATQFHPEKSGDIGLAMLKNFVKLTESETGRRGDGAK